MSPVVAWLGWDTSSTSWGTIVGKKGVIVTTESLGASTLFLIFLSSSFIKVRFVFTSDFLSLDWTDLLSKIIHSPVADVMCTSSISVTSRRRNKTQKQISLSEGLSWRSHRPHCSNASRNLVFFQVRKCWESIGGHRAGAAYRWLKPGYYLWANILGYCPRKGRSDHVTQRFTFKVSPWNCSEVLGGFGGCFKVLHASKIKRSKLRPMQSSAAEAKLAQRGKLLKLSFKSCRVPLEKCL